MEEKEEKVGAFVCYHYVLVWGLVKLVGRPGILDVASNLVVGLLVGRVVLGKGDKNAGSRALGEACSSQIVLARYVDVSDVLVLAQNGQVGDDIDRADVSSDDANTTSIQSTECQVNIVEFVSFTVIEASRCGCQWKNKQWLPRKGRIQRRARLTPVSVHVRTPSSPY